MQNKRRPNTDKKRLFSVHRHLSYVRVFAIGPVPSAPRAQSGAIFEDKGVLR
jgi:hypothetical protein